MPKIKGKAKPLVHHDEMVQLAAPKQFNPLTEVHEPIEPPIRSKGGKAWEVDDLHFSQQILNFSTDHITLTAFVNGKTVKDDKVFVSLTKRKPSKLERKTLETGFVTENNQPHLKPTRKKLYTGMPEGKFPSDEELLKRAQALGLTEEEIAELI